MDIFFKLNLSNGPSPVHANFKQFNSCFTFLTPVLADYLSQGMESVKFAYLLGRFIIPKDIPLLFQDFILTS